MTWFRARQRRSVFRKPTRSCPCQRERFRAKRLRGNSRRSRVRRVHEIGIAAVFHGVGEGEAHGFNRGVRASGFFFVRFRLFARTILASAMALATLLFTPAIELLKNIYRFKRRDAVVRRWEFPHRDFVSKRRGDWRRERGAVRLEVVFCQNAASTPYRLHNGISHRAFVEPFLSTVLRQQAERVRELSVGLALARFGRAAIFV
mmetsp:Transcript_7925/g.26321  ORF Transcript_7925/g.26321 Transcript_7925/m.26321 type:complete len:204 (+) Transcript_7925:683-1294(+)